MSDSYAPQANAIRRAVQEAPRRLWQHYLVALAVILTLLVASFLVREFAISNGLSVAETLNTAGRQRMISQRILLLTSSPPETATDRRDLAALLDEMAAAHQLLSGDPDLADNVRSVYFQPNAATDLDRMMTAFIAAGQALLANDDPPGQRRILHALGRDSLLFRLDAAVKVHDVRIP